MIPIRAIHILSRLVATAGLIALAGCESASAPHQDGRVALIQAPTTCVDVVFPIYFETGSAKLTREAARLVAAARDSARACDVQGIVVKGLAAGPRGADANLALSQRRADAVTLALSKAGFNAVLFEVTAMGEAGAGGRLLHRRAEVRIHLVDKPRAP
jgi:outer membrane protein OmpA-like peptidoglycan-associated protein